MSMQARAEITRKYAAGYRAASKKKRGQLLDEVVAVTGWSRDNARRQLARVLKPRLVGTERKPRERKYSYDTVRVLQQVWAFSGGSCGGGRICGWRW